MLKNKEEITVIGAGSWGSAIALLLAKKGHPIKLWDFNAEHIRKLEQDKANNQHLPGILFPDNISYYEEIIEAVQDVEFIILVVPTHGFRAVFNKIFPHLNNGAVLVSASKGVENDSLLTMSQIMQEEAGSENVKNLHYAVLSGPSFAREVAEEVPTAITLGCKDIEVAQKLQNILSTKYFRVYTSNDTVGLEISGAIKNIVAIAAGICDGLTFGTNTRAALITRGLAEISRLGVALGADQNTFLGLSGVGDLVLTCTGNLSRNRTVGLKLGEGKKLPQVLEEMSMVAEGVKTARSVYNLSKKLNVEMPITEQIYKILYDNKDCRQAVNDLLKRELKQELISE